MGRGLSAALYQWERTGKARCPGNSGAIGARRPLAVRAYQRDPGRRHQSSDVGSRGTKPWVPVQTQAERECEEVDRKNLWQGGMGGGGAAMARETGHAAVERLEQGAAGGGVAAAMEEPTGSGSGNCGPEEVETK